MTLDGSDVGHPKHKGETHPVGTVGFDLLACGEDIWESADQFHFASVAVDGDFDAQVRVEFLEAGHLYTKAGIMARETLEPGSPHFSHIVFPDNRPRNNNCGGHESQYRLVKNGPSKAIYPVDGAKEPPRFPVNYPGVWIRVTRKGSVFEAFSSQDGHGWDRFAHHEQALAKRLLVGLAVTSHDEARTVKARFRDWKL